MHKTIFAFLEQSSIP